ncbi:MAG: DUF3618 domain-containing protein [Streptosporangiales bacterium]|nr:DUF3618 domain-containing protein [Streptosporangiales bacterium]
MADTARDPDALQRDIERTRDELAHAIGEIADRMNPKRAARRRAELFREGTQQFRETVGAKVGVDGTRGIRGAGTGSGLREVSRAEESSAPDDELAAGREGHLGTATYAVRRAKVPLIVGAGTLLAVTAAVVVWRLRRR